MKNNSISFFQDLHDFLQYIKKPSLGVRLPVRRGDGWWSDFKVHTSFKLLWKWLFFLWFFNMVVLGPLALVASEELGATHRIKVDTPYLVLLAAVWAPLVEELLFRYGLRRPKLALVYIPLLIFVFISKMLWLNIAIVGCIVLSFVLLDLKRQTGEAQALPFAWRQRYCTFFPWVFHGSVLVFASLHLMNYELPALGDMWLLPFLILPQWLTGMVIAWMRVRDSFACGVVMHALFNGVPVLLLWMALQFVPAEALSWMFS
ncbi:CPBP family glutamic-type intramembrane protease [Pelistega europaea]|uniref:CPBP family intramembrane metalloprotease n=1 Tax=Pelistega europaea TaxID=106147 RepID=A0A7Y4P4V8_9BURK|nr:CPBP family glutamic-type intramembrane protease [Pelistega europaea]NOL50472.1 CPBP family intramembrane metalloprotease [Pelistega europaea]